MNMKMKKLRWKKYTLLPFPHVLECAVSLPFDARIRLSVLLVGWCQPKSSPSLQSLFFSLFFSFISCVLPTS